MIRVCLLVYFSAFAPAPAASDAPPPEPPPDPRLLAEALARLPARPSLAEVQRAALRRAAVELDDPRRWRRRARLAGLVPTASAQYDHRLDQGWTLDQEAGSADSLSNDGEHQSVLRVKLSWELDRLVYSPEELRVARAAIDLDEWRVRVLTEVTGLYFERQRLLLALDLQPAPSLDEAIELHLRLREVEGTLAGLTGLRFEASSPAPATRALGPSPSR